MCHVVYRQTEPEEAYRSQDNHNAHQHESELRLVDAVVPFGQLHAYPVIEWS